VGARTAARAEPGPRGARRGVASSAPTGGRASGWIHKPAARPGTALVIVPPSATRRSARTARSATRRGRRARRPPAVRFDLDGTGDSAGDDPRAKRVDAWLASIDDACDFAPPARRRAHRARRGAPRRRARGADSRGPRGCHRTGGDRRHARAARRTCARRARCRCSSGSRLRRPASAAPPEDIQELVGFAPRLGDRARSSPRSIRSARSSARAGRVARRFRDDLPGKRTSGPPRCARRRRGRAGPPARYVEMMARFRIAAQVPAAIIDAAIGFAAARPPPPRAAGGRRARGRGRAAEIEVTARSVTRSSSRSMTSSGDGVALRRRPRPRGDLINFGRDLPDRPEPACTSRSLRRLAARGDLVVRVDLSGIGDSRSRRGADGTSSTAITRSPTSTRSWPGRAAGRTRGRGRRPVLGRVHALKAAVAGPADRYGHPDQSAHVLLEARDAARLRGGSHHARCRALWQVGTQRRVVRKLFSGRVDVAASPA